MSDQNLGQTESTDRPVTGLLSRIGGGSGVVGSIVSAMGCVACFPAIASLGAVLGLGFLYQWESLFVHTLIPLFALLALLANAIGWFSHHSLTRSFIGMAGPVLVLLAIYPLFHSDSRNAVLYVGLALMTAFALWDIFIRKKKA